MDDVKKPAPNQPGINKEIDPVTVHKPGGVEGAPARIETPGPVESYVDSSPEQSEVKIPDEVKEAGIEEVKSEPVIPTDSQVQQSIPKGPVYPIPEMDIATSEQAIEKGDSSDANIWRTLISVLKTKREKFIGLFKNNNMQKKSI